MSQTIICPNCKTVIDLDKLLEERFKHKLDEQKIALEQEQEKLRKEFEKTLEEKTLEMRQKALEFAKAETEKQAKKDALEMQDLKNRLLEEEKKQELFQKQELEMRKKQRELEEKAKNADFEMQKKLDEERKKISEQFEKEAQIKQKELEKQMAETQAFALEKQLFEQRKKDEEARKKEQEEFRKKELEYLKQQEQMKRALDEAKRKAEQGSMQIQWDVQEEDLKLALSQAFPIDRIDDVATWVKWADLIQTVHNNLGQKAWTIIWESKNTKSWQDAWIMKLKDDKLKVNGNLAILVTAVLPKDIKHFWVIDDIMVCSPEYAIAIAGILRDKLLSVFKIEKSLQWKDMKMEMLYSYLSSQEFSSKINMMVDVFSELKSGIDQERRAMEKNWKKREKDLERATFAITGMYWELESLMWQALPWAERLSLESGEED